MSYKLLKTELSILEKNFPRNDGCFQIIIASREELVCRFVDTKGNKYNLQCSISVSYIYRELNELVSVFIFYGLKPLAQLPGGTTHLDFRM